MRPSEIYSCTWEFFDRECRGCESGGPWIDDPEDHDTPWCAMGVVMNEDVLLDDGSCPGRSER